MDRNGGPSIDDTPVEGPDAPAEELELQRELVPALSDEAEQDLLRLILRDQVAALQDRGEWEARLAEWEDAYYNRVPDKTFPWVGASNFHVPITMMGVETFKPRLVEGVLGQKPPIFVIPSKQADEGRKETVEAFLNWQIQTDLPIQSLVTQAAHLYLQPGIVIAKTYWKVIRTVRRSIQEFPSDAALDDVLKALFGDAAPTDIESTGPLTWEGTVPGTAQSVSPAHVSVKAKFLERGLQMLVDREEVVERPAIDLIEAIDFITPAHGGAEVADLPWCQHRMWLYEEDLRERARAGRFDPDRVEALIEQLGPSGGSLTQLDAAAYREIAASTEGVVNAGPSDVRREQYEILEDYRRYDIDDDGQLEEIVTWVAPALSDGILGWDYLDNVYAHGRRPFRVGRYFPIPFRFLGLSFAEVVKGIQDEINAIHNQRVDYGTLQNVPFYFYRASSTTFPTTVALKPGEGMPVDNPQQDILFPKWQGTPAWGFQEEAGLMQTFERLSGLTDLSLGRQPNRVGATRTAAGTQTLLSEAGLRFKVALQGFQTFWIGVFADILALDQHYLPPEVEFRVVGRLPSMLRLKDRLELRGSYDLRLASTSETLNRDQMRQDASTIFQLLLNPALMQGGLVGLKGVRRAANDLLRAYGKDPEFYLEDVVIIRDPVEELMMMASGQIVVPSPGEDVQAHLAAHQQQLADPALPVEVRQRLLQHLQETQQLQMAQQMAAALPQRGGPSATGQQAMNAEQGRQPQIATPPTAPPAVEPEPAL